MVIFSRPGSPGFDLVKRVIGLPGETIVISNGQVHANDAIVAEPWADGPTLPDGEWQLAGDEVFVLGDNRAVSSADSRTIGPVPLAAVGWEVVARYWPLGSAGRI
jgi:signal peptidase I